MQIHDNLPKTTLAAILVELNQALIVDEIKLPNELQPGQVLVELYYSGICGSQLGEIRGVKGYDHYLPHLLGHEGVGRVLQIGPGVRYIKDNDLVVLHWVKGQGIDAAPANYLWNGKKVNAGWITTFNKHAIISENRLTVINDDSTLKTAPLFGCAITTGFGVITNDAKLKIGESVAIFGAGGVGLNMIQAAKLTSADPIFAIDLYDHKLELAQTLGATHIINAQNCDPFKEITNILGQNHLDVFIDNTGIPDIIEKGYKLISNQGRLVLVGVPNHDRDIKIHSLPIHFGKKIIGSHGGEAAPNQDIPRYMRLYEKNYIKLDSLISKVYSLEDINDALNAMRNSEVSGRIVIDMREVL